MKLEIKEILVDGVPVTDSPGRSRTEVSKAATLSEEMYSVWTCVVQNKHNCLSLFPRQWEDLWIPILHSITKLHSITVCSVIVINVGLMAFPYWITRFCLVS